MERLRLQGTQDEHIEGPGQEVGDGAARHGVDYRH
jgi:hypothetical protein